MSKKRVYCQKRYMRIRERVIARVYAHTHCRAYVYVRVWLFNLLGYDVYPLNLLGYSVYPFNVGQPSKFNPLWSVASILIQFL